MESLHELYRIGTGPSSSHTMGSERAARRFRARYPQADRFSVTLYGSAMANSRGLFTVFRLNLDAQGNVAALDVRDFTTRATYLYSVKLDPLGNAYAVAQDYKHPIAVVPFDALPVCDNPGLTLTNGEI